MHIASLDADISQSDINLNKKLYIYIHRNFIYHCNYQFYFVIL